MSISNVISFAKDWVHTVRSPLFNSRYYHEKYGVNRLFAAFDYLYKGCWEFKNPSELFDTKEYYESNPDIPENTRLLPFHIIHGKMQRRIYIGAKDCELYHYGFVSALFDMEWYIHTYMSKKEIRQYNPIYHYCEIGWKKDYLPFRDFDLDAFRRENPECDECPLCYLLRKRMHSAYSKKPSNNTTAGYRFGEFLKNNAVFAQNKDFYSDHPNSVNCKKIILFLLTDYDAISGGLMSMCGMYDILKDISASRGYDDVLAITFPWSNETIHQYSLFDNDMPIYRYGQLVKNYPNLEEILIMLPEMYSPNYMYFIESHPESPLARCKIHLNIMNQNIQLMPLDWNLDRIQCYCDKITQTVAHRKYCNDEYRVKWNMPLHLLIPPIKKKFVIRPYEEKENIFAYSLDTCEYKETILKLIKQRYPDMELIEIKDLQFREYLDLISRAKWVMSFGEGLDGYFTEPYYSGGVAFSVWNDEFFTENYRDLPTVFKSYPDAVNRIIELMESLDNKEEYERVSKMVHDVHYSDYNSGPTPESMLMKFLDEEYDFP